MVVPEVPNTDDVVASTEADLKYFLEAMKAPAEPPTLEEEAAIGIAVSLAETEDGVQRSLVLEGLMAAEFSDELRPVVMNDLLDAIRTANGLSECWMSESEPAELLGLARILRESARSLVSNVERWWPNSPPTDYTV
jgi:hypothetical protein